MNASKPQRRRSTIGEDGEIKDLQSLLDEPDVPTINQASAIEQEPAFCTQCGVANMPNAQFCRKCGSSLHVAPELDSYSGMSRKRKPQTASRRTDSRLADEADQHSSNANIFAVLTQLMMLPFVAGMVITSFIGFHSRESSPFFALPVLLAWFLVEAVRRDKASKATWATLVTEGVTLLFVTGMVITAFVFNPFFALPILLVWFLVEAVRS